MWWCSMLTQRSKKVLLRGGISRSLQLILLILLLFGPNVLSEFVRKECLEFTRPETGGGLVRNTQELYFSVATW
jgi:hypothetical protein